MPAWRSITLRLQASPQTPAAFIIDSGSGGQPQHRATLPLDTSTGRTVGWETFDTQSAGRRLRSWMRFTHTGEFYGVVGQTIAGLASAGGVVLVYTGLALVWRRVSGRLFGAGAKHAGRDADTKAA